MSDWSLFEIVAAWRALEFSEKGQLCPGGWAKKLKDMEKAFLLKNCSQMLEYEKELRAISSHFIKERIDEAPEPNSKNGANVLPYRIWHRIISKSKEDMRTKTAEKCLRASQGYVLLCWTLSTGARLKELLRLRKSDLSFVSSNGMSCIKITVRRGKRSRVGKKPVFYYAHENRTVPMFCPVAAFLRYGELKFGGEPIMKERSDLVFPQKVKSSHNGTILTPKGHKKKVTGRMIAFNWRTICKKLKLPSKWYVGAHSGRRQIINAAWAQDQTNEQILDITNWSSTRVLPEYVSGPKSTSLNVKMTSMSVEDLDKTCSQFL